MSKPTPEIPPKRPDESPKNEHDAALEQPVETTAPDKKPIIDDVSAEEVPATDISLISGGTRARHYKADNPSFCMQRGYQALLMLGLIAAFILVMVYQTLFGRIEQPQQMVTIESGQTYYGLLPQWKQQVPLF